MQLLHLFSFFSENNGYIFLTVMYIYSLCGFYPALIFMYFTIQNQTYKAARYAYIMAVAKFTTINNIHVGDSDNNYV